MFGAQKTPKVPTPAEAIALKINATKGLIEELKDEHDQLALDIAIVDTTLEHANTQLARYEREARELRDASIE